MKHVVSILAAWIVAGMLASAQVGSLINYGAVVKDSLRIENAGAFVRMPAGSSIRWGDVNVGILTSASLTGAQSWILPNESGVLLTSTTQFAAATGSVATVSGTYNGLNIQLKNGSVVSSHIADGTITDSDISPSAAIAVGKLAPGSTGQVLTTIGTTPQWSSLATLEDDPQVGTFSVGQVAFWNGTALIGNANLFWDNTNARLGIGTSSPSVALDVTGSARLASAASTTVVIGNVSADGKLRVDGSIRADSYRSADGTASSPAFRFTNSASTGMFSPASNQLALSTNGTERIRLDAIGNVGIGTSSPSSRLTVAGTVTATQYSGALQYGITAGTGLSGGTFDNTGNVTFALTNTGVTAGTYGSATQVPQITVDAQGRITNVSTVTLSVPGETDPTAWRLAGNSGTNPTTDFLGTTDAKPLVIKVKGEEVFRFEVPDLVTAGWSIHRGGGNPRGIYAVDMQIGRVYPSQVASGDFSVIGGGSSNTASGESSTIAGGADNTASGDQSTVGGGALNVATGYASTVSGGLMNSASGIYAAISGGRGNTASGVGSIVGGGGDLSNGNVASGDFSGVLGGLANTASGDYSAVAGGSVNVASGAASVVGGGQHNTAAGVYATIPGGTLLKLGDYSFGYSGQELGVETNLSDSAHIAAFVDVDLWLYNVRNQASQLRLYEPSGSGRNFTAFRAQPQAADIVYTLPASITAGGVLTTDANGNLSWVAPSSSSETDPTAWKLTGNSGTTAGTNFLGTTDNQALVIKTNNTEAARFTTNQRLDFQGGSGNYRVDLPNNSSVAVGRIRAQGYATYSSRAWKEEIRPIEGALEKVLRLTGVQYRWKPEYGGTRDIGFVMEEVAEVVPEVVDRDGKTGEYLGMEYSRLTALLVEALKEEHRRNEALRTELEQLRRERQTAPVEQLRSEVERLRAIVEQLSARYSAAPQTPMQGDDAWLGDNIPNPHEGTTVIPYYVPSGVGSAELVIEDGAGRRVLGFVLSERGVSGQVVVRMEQVASGRYEYRLVLDGRVVSSKAMQLVR